MCEGGRERDREREGRERERERETDRAREKSEREREREREKKIERERKRRSKIGDLNTLPCRVRVVLNLFLGVNGAGIHVGISSEARSFNVRARTASERDLKI